MGTVFWENNLTCRCPDLSPGYHVTSVQMLCKVCHQGTDIRQGNEERKRERKKCEPPHDKTNKMTVRPAKTQVSLGIRPVWSESSLSAWRKLGSLATHWAHSEDSDQTGRMPKLIWVFSLGAHAILLVLSWGGSYKERNGRKAKKKKEIICYFLFHMGRIGTHAGYFGKL